MGQSGDVGVSYLTAMGRKRSEAQDGLEGVGESMGAWSPRGFSMEQWSTWPSSILVPCAVCVVRPGARGATSQPSWGCFLVVVAVAVAPDSRPSPPGGDNSPIHPSTYSVKSFLLPCLHFSYFRDTGRQDKHLSKTQITYLSLTLISATCQS